MKTDLNRLTRFESAIVFMIVIGISIIGMEIYVSLPKNVHVSVQNSFAIFDLREEFVEQANIVAEGINLMNQVHDQILFSFVQLIDMPDEMNMVLDATETAYQKTVAFVNDFQSNSENSTVAFESTGKVLGISTTQVDAHDYSEVQEPGYTFNFDINQLSLEKLGEYVPLLKN